MIIEKLSGVDDRMYELVAPLVMNETVIRQNNNYPFKTSCKHIWFIAIDEGEVVGFMPVKNTLRENRIDNYYVAGEDPELLTALIEAAKEEFLSDFPLTAMAHVRHVDLFRACGFTDVKEWKLYVKLECHVDREPEE